MSGTWVKLRKWILAEEGGQAEAGHRGNGGTQTVERPEQIVVTRPRSLDEAHSCASLLKDQRTVVVNLSILEQQVARRALDFLGGVVYAIDGQMEEAGDGIYVLTPSVTLMSNEAERGQALPLG